jgi:hypothetical protein
VKKPIPMPPIPPHADRLRDVRKVIKPDEVYQVELPGGGAYVVTGAELIASADHMIALVDAQRAGDEAGIRRAVLDIMGEDYGVMLP